jgi:hypothetical protein
MSTALSKLVSIGSPPIRSTPLDLHGLSEVEGVERRELELLLRKKNGFYAFCSSRRMSSALNSC